MATRAATFYPSSTDQDFTAPSEGNIRKYAETIGGSDDTATVTFGDGTGDFVVDPYTGGSTVAPANAANYGWALNRDGADGMAVPDVPAGFTSAVRFVPAGLWQFQGRIGVALASLATVRAGYSVYRVSSSGARSLLLGPVWSAAVTPTTAGDNVTVNSASQPEYTFAQDETLLVTIRLNKTNSTIGSASTVEWRLNDTFGNDCLLFLPGGGIRTRFTATVEQDARGAVAITRKVIAKDVALDARGTLTGDKQVSVFRSVDIDARATLSTRKAITKPPRTIDARGTVDPTTSRVRLTLDELPDVDAPPVVVQQGGSAGGPANLRRPLAPRRLPDIKQSAVVRFPHVASLTLRSGSPTTTRSVAHVEHHARLSLTSTTAWRADVRHVAPLTTCGATRSRLVLDARSAMGAFGDDDLIALMEAAHART